MRLIPEGPKRLEPGSGARSVVTRDHDEDDRTAAISMRCGRSAAGARPREHQDLWGGQGRQTQTGGIRCGGAPATPEILMLPLVADGFRLVQTGTVSGSLEYSVRSEAAGGTPADYGISAALSAFDTGTIHERWEEALSRRSSDPRGAITTARTLLEDTCKWILTEGAQPFAEDADLPVLYRQLAKLLKLAPDDHTEPVFKQILGSCQSIVESLGALRNKVGDAHSQGPKRARPQPRHAELAVNLAGTMATFLIATWEARQSPPSGA